MTTRRNARNSLPKLWQRYISQPNQVSDETRQFVSALRTRVDELEQELATWQWRTPPIPTNREPSK